jgi:hypothetical protein
MSTREPEVPAGEVAVMDVLEFTVKGPPQLVPKQTAVAPWKELPVMCTDVPPDAEPAEGETFEIDGPEKK